MFVNPASGSALDVQVILKPSLLHSGDTAYVHVKVTDATGPVTGATLTATPTSGIATPTTGTTNSTGESVFAFTLPSTAVPMHVAVVVNASAASHADGTGEGVGTLLPMLDLRLSATAQKTTLYAGEKSKVTIVVDSNSALISGAALAYTLTGPGSLSASNGTTNSTGGAEVEYTAPATIPSKQTSTLSMTATKPGYTPGTRTVLFALEPTPDTSAPYIVSTTPTNGSTGVSVNSTLQIKWNESMDPATSQGAFSSSPTIQCTWSWPSADLQVCTPRSPLQASTLHDVSVSTSARDVAGNQMKKPYGYSFTTGGGGGGGGNAPTVTSTTPANGAIGVPVTTQISFTFDMAMNTSASQGALSVSPVVTGSFAWTSGDRVLTLTPGAALANGTAYTATLGTAAKSAAGVALPSAFILSFTTQTGGGGNPVPPTVSGTSPPDGATGVPRNANIVIDFDKGMDPVSAQGALSSNPPATGSFSWTSGNTRLTLNPSADLAGDTLYEFVVAKSAKSATGAAMAADHKFSFKTEPVPDTEAPKIVHLPVTRGVAGQDISIQANVSDDVALGSVKVQYRLQGAGGWTPLNMVYLTGEVYRGSIPGGAVTVGVIEYYLEAEDSAGNRAREPAGGSSTPLRITVVKDDSSGGGAAGGIGTYLIAGLIAAAAIASIVALLLVRRKKRANEVAMSRPPAGPPDWLSQPQGPPDQQWHQESQDSPQ
jgi:hypothetical protein